MTQSEGTSQSASGSSSGAASSGGRTRKKPTAKRARRGTGGAATRTRRKTTTKSRKASTRGTRRTTAPRKATRPRRTGTARRRTASRPAGLQGFLNDLARRANRAGATIADLSEGGTDAARRTLGTVSETSRETIARVRREWDRLDTSRRVEFVAGLLGALAAATAGVRTLTKK